MALRDWSARRIATMWLAVFVIEAGIMAVSSYRSREIRAEMRRTNRELGTSFVDSIPDSTSGFVLRRTNPRADSVLDSAMALLGRVIADTGVQQTIADGATEFGRAVTKSLILAALLLLPLPISAFGVTLRWLWLRRRNVAHAVP